MSVRRLTFTTLAWLCALAGGLAFSAPAFASVEHVLAGSFGQGIIKNSVGIAVNDATHNVYPLVGPVQEFTPTGEYIRSFGSREATFDNEFRSVIATDNSDDPLDPSREDVYVLYQEGGFASFEGVVEKFSAEGVSLGRFGSGTETLGVGPEGQVWTGHERQISIFSDAETNVPVSTWTLPEGFGLRGQGQLLVNSEDDLYLEGPTNHRFTKFSELPGRSSGNSRSLSLVDLRP